MEAYHPDLQSSTPLVRDRQKLGDGMGYRVGGRVKETMLYGVER
jgi:hypothetical protein